MKMKVPKEAFRAQFFSLLPVYMNILSVGCATGWCSIAFYFFENHMIGISPTAFQYAMITTYADIARVFFAFPAGIFFDKYGSKKTTNCAGLLHFSSMVILSLNSSLITIYIARLLSGVAISFTYAGSVSISEIASPEIRGRLNMISDLFFRIGLLIPSIVTTTFSFYQIVPYSLTVISTLYIVLIHWLRETPNHLINKSRLDEAKNNLRHLRLGYCEADIITEFEKLRKYIEEEKNRKKENTWLQFIKSGPIRKPILISFLIHFFTASSGGIFISAYQILILPDIGIIAMKNYPLITQCIQITASILMTYIIDRFPRKVMYMMGSALTAIASTFCLSTEFWLNTYNESISNYLFLINNFIILVSFAGCLRPIMYTLKSEILPQQCKGVGGSLSMIGLSTGTVVSFYTYHIISEFSSSYYFYTLFSISSISLCALIYFCIPESQGRFLADIQNDFQGFSPKKPEQ